ncbi:hypothetical protein ACO0SA_003999 [Hanseniaspora valbyensis]
MSLNSEQLKDGKSCLLIIDMQYDFINGSLKVNGGEEIVPIISDFLKKNGNQFDLIVFTKDDHPSNHISFASSHKNKKPFEEYTYVSEKDPNHTFKSCLWPDHCVVGTHGNEIHSDLAKLIANGKVNNTKALVVGKGMDPKREYYSCFNDVLEEHNTDILEVLKKENISNVYVCGLAYDYCVLNSAKSSKKFGFKTYVIDNMTRKIDPNWEFNEPGIEKIQM